MEDYEIGFSCIERYIVAKSLSGAHMWNRSNDNGLFVIRATTSNDRRR
jgi:hypothetical protein